MAGDVTRLSVGIFASSEEFERAMTNIGRELDGFKAKANQAGVAANLMGKNVGLGAGASGDAIKLNTFQLQNMQFQMQDIAISLATGQSPFRVMAQQGSQIVQIFGPRTGVQAALKAVGAGIKQFVTNPLNIALLAITATAGVVGLLTKNLFKQEEAAKDNKDSVKSLTEAIKALDEASGAANMTQEERTRLAQKATETFLEEERATRKTALARLELLKQDLESPFGPMEIGGTALAQQVQEREGLQKRIDGINDKIAEGEARLRVTSAELARLEIQGLSDPAAAARDKLKEAEAALLAQRKSGAITELEFELGQLALTKTFEREAEAARKAGREREKLGKVKVEPDPLIGDLDKLLRGNENKIANIFEKTRTPLEALKIQLSEIEALRPFARNAEDLEAFDRALKVVNEKIDFESLSESAKEFKRAAKEAGRGIADAFAGAIVFGERLDRTLARLIQRLAFEALANLFLSALPAPFRGKAGGGRIGPNVATLVGERGPEIIVPQRAATVINAADSRRATGGAQVSVTQNISANFAGGAATQDDLRLMGQITREAAIAGTMAALRRPRFA